MHDIAFILEVLLETCLVVVFACLIGYNRETKNQVAGVRTHVLVALGSLLSILVPIITFMDYPYLNIDPFRLSAQVISGIGFLGAGSIVKSGQYIKGLTTAASLWITAIIAITIGAGYFILGSVIFLVTFSFLTIYSKLSILNSQKYAEKVITLKYNFTPTNKQLLIDYLKDLGISEKYETVLSQSKEKDNIVTVTSLKIKYVKNDIDIEHLIEHLIKYDFVINVKFNSELDKLF